MRRSTALRAAAAALGALLLSACAGGLGPADPEAPVITAPVAAPAALGPASGSAGGLALWRNPRGADGLAIVSDGRSGLYAFGLEGRARQYLPAGRLTALDVRGDLALPDAAGGAERRGIAVVAAADATLPAESRLGLYKLELGQGPLRPLLTTPAGLGELGGVCLQAVRRGPLHAVLVARDGAVRRLALSLTTGAGTVSAAGSFRLPGAGGACAVDDAAAALFVASEAGVWRAGLAAGAPAPVLAVAADGARLPGGAAGVAVLPDASLLLASAAADGAIAVFRLEDGAYVGRVALTSAGGAAVKAGALSVAGRGPDAALAVQDRAGMGPASVRLIPWRQVEAALLAARGR